MTGNGATSTQLFLLAAGLHFVPPATAAGDSPAAVLPKSGTVVVDSTKGEMILSVFWQAKDGTWVEKAYEHFATELQQVGEEQIEKPWTPHFVFHGSGAIHKSGTGCIACPCDCPGGIIADNRFPIYDPKPTVRFDISKTPPPGTQVYVRIRPIASRAK